MEESVVAALPGWVGRRVVVRHLLPDGRATDALGTLESADDQEVVVRRDRVPAGSSTDPLTRVAAAAVVAARTVPPPPLSRAPGRR